MFVSELPADKFDIVETFVVDVMHAFLQNTTRRFVYSMQDSTSKSPGRIMPSNFRRMDKIWLSFKFPIEFIRPYPQSLAKKKEKTAFDMEIQLPGINTWKATQLRSWALYGSCMVIHGFASRETQTAWRHLVFAMRILCNKDMCFDPKWNPIAKDFIKSFQLKLLDVFPRMSQMSLHVLRHLPEDCMRLRRPADQFSCFWGENSLKTMKKLVHTAKNPLGNVTKALRGNGATFTKKASPKFRERFLHRIPDLNTNADNYYRGVQTEKFRIVGERQREDEALDAVVDALYNQGPTTSRIPERNLRLPSDTDENAYFSAFGFIYKAATIVRKLDHPNRHDWKANVYIQAHKYKHMTPAYHVYHGTEKMKSDIIGIWFVKDLDIEPVLISLLNVDFKCVSHVIDGLRYVYKIL